MKKTGKIVLIIFITIFVGIIAFGSTILYSYYNVDYQIDNTTITFDISFDIFDGYIGFIKTETPASIQNGGLYDVKNINVSIEVYGQNFSTSTLNGALLSKGENIVGDVNSNTDWTGSIFTNITYYIPLLAIFDGDLVIYIDVSFQVNFVLFKIPINVQVTQIVNWDSPFGL